MNFILIYLAASNLALILVPLIIHFMFRLTINIPPDYFSYLDYFNSITTTRTIGYPLILKLVHVTLLKHSLLLMSICIALIALILSGRFLTKVLSEHSLNKDGVIQKSVYSNMIVLLLSVLICPWALFSVLLPLPDFLYSLLACTSLFCLNSYICVFQDYRKVYATKNKLALIGLVFGTSTLLKPVGLYLPIFLLALFLLIYCLMSFVLGNLSITLKPKITREILSILLIFFVTSSLPPLTYSIYTKAAFGTFNITQIAAVNINCWRNIHESQLSSSPFQAYKLRYACQNEILQGQKYNKSNYGTINLMNIITTKTLSITRSIIDSDFISYLNYLGLYSTNHSYRVSTVDFYYSKDFRSALDLVIKKFDPRFLMFSIAAMFIASINSVLFWMISAKRIFLTRVSWNLRLMILVECLYYMLVSTGSDTAGRYYLPIAFLLSLYLSQSVTKANEF
jgi:hypothetical protein